MMRLLFQLLALCIVASAWPLSGAELVRGPVVAFTNGQATVRWSTDVATGGRVFFGETAGSLTRRADGPVTTDHVVVLPSLPSGSSWVYSVGTARVPLATNRFSVPGAATAGRAPPARETWGYLPSLQDHFERHGADFRARDAEDYARLAWEFQQRAKAERLPTKVDADGVVRVFDPKSGAFAAYNRNGTTKTFFKPNSPTYFQRQPGELVQPKGGR
jgi:hypothetical protein